MPPSTMVEGDALVLNAPDGVTDQQAQARRDRADARRAERDRRRAAERELRKERDAQRDAARQEERRRLLREKKARKQAEREDRGREVVNSHFRPRGFQLGGSGVVRDAANAVNGLRAEKEDRACV